MRAAQAEFGELWRQTFAAAGEFCQLCHQLLNQFVGACALAEISILETFLASPSVGTSNSLASLPVPWILQSILFGFDGFVSSASGGATTIHRPLCHLETHVARLFLTMATRLRVLY